MIKLAIIEPKNTAAEKRGVDYYVDRLVTELKKEDNLHIEFRPFEYFTSYNEFDLIHVPYFEPFSFGIPPLANKPLVVTIHDVTRLIFPSHFPAGPRGKIEWAVQKKILGKINAVITDSNNSKSDIERLLKMPLGKISVTHLAADSNFKKIFNKQVLEAVRKRYNLPAKFVLYVGEANWNKNVLSLCQACSNLKIPLVLVGKVWLKGDDYRSDNIENTPLEMVLDYIKGKDLFIRPGFVPTSDLVSLYNSADLYVQPSTYEGFGLPLLEAMSCGTPVVSTKVSSLPEIAADAAIYAKDTSTEGLSDAIKKFFALSAKEKEVASQKALIQAKKFSWAATAAATIAVYKSVLNEKS